MLLVPIAKSMHIIESNRNKFDIAPMCMHGNCMAIVWDKQKVMIDQVAYMC